MHLRWPFLQLATRLLYLQGFADLRLMFERLSRQMAIMALALGPGALALAIMMPVTVAWVVSGREEARWAWLIVALVGASGIVLRRTFAREEALGFLPVPRWLLRLSRGAAQVALLAPVGCLLALGWGIALVEGGVPAADLSLRWLVLASLCLAAQTAVAQWPGPTAGLLYLASTAWAWLLGPGLPWELLLAVAPPWLLLALVARPAHRGPMAAITTAPLRMVDIQVLTFREGGQLHAITALSLTVAILMGGWWWVTRLPAFGMLPGALVVCAGVSLVVNGWARAVAEWFARREVLLGTLPITQARYLVAVLLMPVVIQGVAVACVTGAVVAMGPLAVLWLWLFAGALALANLVIQVRLPQVSLVASLLFSVIFIRVASHVQLPV